MKTDAELADQAMASLALPTDHWSYAVAIEAARLAREEAAWIAEGWFETPAATNDFYDDGQKDEIAAAIRTGGTTP